MTSSTQKPKRTINKKALKWSAISLMCILAVALIFIIAIFANGAVVKDNGLENPLVCDEFFSEWQSTIVGSAKINEVATVGSHDAGSAGMMPIARTQGHSIYDQLRGGARYFDLRVCKSRGELVIFHSIIKGQKFSTVIDDINRFIAENPSEFLILDFQHLGSSAHDEIITAIEDGLDMSKAMLKSVFSKIETTTMADVRENGYNYAIVWNSASEAENKDYFYVRNEHLQSPYDRSYHASFNTDKLINRYQKYYDDYDGKGFFVLQAQRTAPTVFNIPADNELEFKDKINNYVASLAQDSVKLAKTNIVMRDYVVSDMTNVKTILALNLAKGIVSEQSIARYTAAVAV